MGKRAKKARKAKAKTVSVKAGVVRIPSNGLETQEEGWVEMHAYLKTIHLPYFQGLKLGALQKVLDEEVSPFDEDYEPALERKERAMRVVHRLLSVFVLDWNWAYPDGTAYVSPCKNIEAFELVQLGEFEWLFARMGEILTDEEITIPKSSDTPS